MAANDSETNGSLRKGHRRPELAGALQGAWGLRRRRHPWSTNIWEAVGVLARYLQGSSGHADTEKRLVDAAGEGEGGTD